jgi:phenylacetate-CoA ligase
MGHALEKLYPYMPVWAQNLGISLFGLAYRHERLGGDFEQHVAGFRERDRWTPTQMQEHVEQELRRVLLRAFDQVPYYRAHWQVSRQELARMTVADLPKLPITPKQDLRAAPDDFLARDCRRRVHRYATSGSTGTPVTVACTAEDHRRYIAAREVRSFGWAGTSVRRPRSMIGGRRVVPRGVARAPFHRYNWAEHQVYFSAYHIAPAHVAGYVAAFNKYRPELLTGYAYAHYLLARMMIAQGVALDYEPTAAVLSSEKLTAEMKRVIRQALRTRAFEEYGAVENCLLATECERGRLHVSPDFGVLEIIDATGRPVPLGVEGRVVCTSLSSEAQPLVRYELGDAAIWAKSGCECGRDHLPVLEEVVGRLEDVVVGTDGREMVRFHGIFIDLPNVIEGQVVQEAIDRLTLKLVTRDGFGAAEERVIRERFAERLGPVQVQIERVPEIARTERGKFRAVISRLERR